MIAILRAHIPAPLRVFLALLLAFAMARYVIPQCRKPSGWLGRFLVRIMNRSHSWVTAWGLRHVEVGRRDTVLDIGCGGGRTLQRLAAMADLGKVYGVDYSEASVAASRRFNHAAVESGRIEIQTASVSHLPFPDNTFDLVTAVETHYYWPDYAGDMREILRVLKPGGSLLIVAESYRGGGFGVLYKTAMKALAGAHLSPEEHTALLVNAGYEDTEVALEPKKGWICATGRKPR